METKKFDSLIEIMREQMKQDIISELQNNRIDIDTACMYNDPTGALEKEYQRANDMLDACICTIEYYFKNIKEDK